MAVGLFSDFPCAQQMPAVNIRETKQKTTLPIARLNI
jgi:hypothetical protein